VSVVGIGWALAAAAIADEGGGDRVYLATCREGRAELVASVGADGLRPEVGPAWDDAPDPALAALGARLAEAAWYRYRTPLPEPFAPFVRSTWNDPGSTAEVPAPCTDLCGDQLLVLGACPAGAEGGLWATAPFDPVPLMALPVVEDRAPRRDGAGVQESVVLRDRAGAEVAVLDEARGVLASGPTTWIGLRGLGAVGVVPALGPEQTAYAAVLAVGASGAVDTALVLVDGEGC
jgi:hypothetical protein